MPCCVLGWNAAIQPAISLGKHCLIEIAHWNRGVSFEQSPLRLCRWGWASCQCFETPRHSQRSRDFLEFLKTLEKMRAKWFPPKYQPVRPSTFWRGGLPLSRRWDQKLRSTRRSTEGLPHFLLLPPTTSGLSLIHLCLLIAGCLVTHSVYLLPHSHLSSLLSSRSNTHIKKSLQSSSHKAACSSATRSLHGCPWRRTTKHRKTNQAELPITFWIPDTYERFSFVLE